jgi:Protein kinase domain
MSTPQTIGKYQVMGRIGSGAMGEVYKALDPVLNRHVALKTMSAEFGSDPELRQRFEREAQSAARLTHPHIVTVYELGEEAGHTFIAMELLEGQDLKVLLGGPRLAALEAKLRVMDQVCDALAFAHAHDVVHRDLKPANIRVLPSGALKVMDFGLAHLAGSEMTRAGMVMGTPHYMSPEQVRGQKVDARSDVFSLGAVFYELLTGRKAFEAPSLHGILQKVVDEQPMAVGQMDGSVPPALVAVVERALDKDPAARFAHAGEMRAALHAACLAMGRSLPGESWSGNTLGDAATMHDAGAAPTPGTLVPRRSVVGATALDLRPLAQPETRVGGPATLRGAGLTHAAPAQSSSRTPVVVGLVVVLGLGLAIGGGIWVSRRRAATSATDVQQERAGALKEALLDNRVELARVELQNKDYASAISQAQQALQLDPNSADARSVIERAQAAQRECDEVARTGQDALKRGDTAQASTALTRLLSLDPRHAAVGTLSAALNAYFHGQANDARQSMIGARAAARAQAASGFDGFPQAEQLGQQGETLMASSEFAVATQKFTEAHDGYERAQHAAELQARKLAEAALRTPTPTLATRPTPVAEARLNLPSLPPIGPSLAPSVAPTAPLGAPPLPAGQDAAIRAVVNDYARAITAKDVALFKSVKPNLSDADAKRLQEGFKATKSNQVQAQVDRVESDGKSATVRISRQDTIEGKAMRPMQQTLRLVLTPGGWKIESIGQ